MSNWVLVWVFRCTEITSKSTLCMGVARYDIYQQRKCFTAMKKETDAKFDINSDIKTCSRTIFHSKL